MNDRRERLRASHLYLVCDDRPDEFLERALHGGVDIVQLRMKDAPDQAILTAAQRFARLCERYGALFVLNDRPDLAVAVEADGVHLGQDDVAVGRARALVGAERLIGLSTHSPAQIDAAAGAGVDYIGVGPVHATPTKPGRPAVGLDLVAYAAASTQLPFFAIGGIDPSNVDAVQAAGATRIAVVRALTEAEDPEPVAALLRKTSHAAPRRRTSEAGVAGR